MTDTEKFMRMLPRLLPGVLVVLLAAWLSHGSLKLFLCYGVAGVAAYLIVLFVVVRARGRRSSGEE